QTLSVDWIAQGAGTAILSAATWSDAAAPLPPAAPAAPTGVTATPTGKGKINIAWADNSNNETGFTIERAPDAGGAPGSFAPLTTVGANVSQFLDAGNADNTKCWYRVTANGTVGNTLQTGPAVTATTRIVAVTG